MRLCPRPALIVSAPLFTLLTSATARAQPKTDAVPSPWTPEQQVVIDNLVRENQALRGRADRLEGELLDIRKAQTMTAPEPRPQDGDQGLRPGKWLRPSLFAEIEYRLYPAEEEGIDGFAVGHFRPGLVLAPVRWARAVTSFELAGESPRITDVFATFTATSWLDFDVGYQKPPLIASFVYEPVHTLAFPTYSGVAETFRIDRDVGAGVRIHPREAPVEVMARIGNGTGSALGNEDPAPAGLFLNRNASDVTASSSHGLSGSLTWWPVPFLYASAAGYALDYLPPPIEEPDRSWSFGLNARLGFAWGLGRDS